MAVFVAGEVFGGAFGYHESAAGPTFGAHVDHPVGSLHDVEVVLDDYDRIALVDKRLQDAEQFAYVLDEPTTGLHMSDITHLLAIMDRLVDGGNSVIVIEHNLDVVKTADWIIDMGPEGGSGGGRIIAEGSPETVATIAESHTGGFLRDTLGDRFRPVRAPRKARKRA